MLFLVVAQGQRNSALVQLALAHAVVVDAVGRHTHSFFERGELFLDLQIFVVSWAVLLHRDGAAHAF